MKPYSQLSKEELTALKEELEKQFEDVKGKVCSKRIVQVLENLIQESDFTLADLNQLQQVLEEKKAEAVETVPCNCMS